MFSFIIRTKVFIRHCPHAWRCFLIFAEFVEKIDYSRIFHIGVISEHGRDPCCIDIGRARLPHQTLAMLDATFSRADVDAALGRLTSCATFVVAAYASVTAYQGSLSLGGDLPHAMETLLASSKPVVLVALGNPYLLRSFPNCRGLSRHLQQRAAFEAAAVRALWGEIDIRGHLPVTIPGLAARGDGIQVARTNRTAAP